MNEETINKLTKLLSLAKSGNIHEAELAMAKATAIATEYGIDLAIVAARNEKPKDKLDLIAEAKSEGQRLAVTQKYASWVIQNHFNVHIIYSGSRATGRSLSFIGDKRDVEFAKYLNDFIQDDMQRRWENYKAITNASVKQKATYMYNMYLGLTAKLDKARREAYDTKVATINDTERPVVEQQYALIVADKKDQVQNFVYKVFPNLRKTKVYLNVNTTGQIAKDAYAEGQTINLNRPISC